MILPQEQLLLETLVDRNLQDSRKRTVMPSRYEQTIALLHDHGIQVNGSFVFGLDGDGPDVFSRTVDWAATRGLVTATFHIATPYPGTAFFDQIEAQGRLLHRQWDRYDTRQAVFQPAKMTPKQLEDGYWRAYREFYSWRNIARGARAHLNPRDRVRHLAYAGAWKKLEPMWDRVIRSRSLRKMRPLLEGVLAARRDVRGRIAAPSRREAA